MFTNTLKHTYSITLPSTTSKDVTEWFEIMENNNQLTEALIELVHNGIVSGKYLNTGMYNMTVQGEPHQPEAGQAALQDNFMDSLYNWKDSASAVFKDGKEEKREKKRMLSV